MENRREYYRQALAPDTGVSVLLRASDGSVSFFCEMVDLSIGGMCVLLNPCTLSPTLKWVAIFSLPAISEPLHIPVEPVYSEDEKPGRCGIRFLPRSSPRLQEQHDRQICRFLLEEQRGERRNNRAATA
jgi:c-di-GMP-binding flagellar brake protein YcgR